MVDTNLEAAVGKVNHTQEEHDDTQPQEVTMTVMNKYLVEVLAETFDGNMVMPVRCVVSAASARRAFTIAEAAEPEPFLYSAEELKVVVRDALWVASDGSMSVVEVRKLP